MELNEAIELIHFHPSEKKNQIWVDLGCGSGLFTKALASLLPQGSTIHAIDKDEKALVKIPRNVNGVTIKTSLSNFLNEDVFFHGIDGLLMANSLHFVPYKQSFLRTNFKSLNDDGLLLLVEYDLNIANTWVPYPVTTDEIQVILKEAGFKSFKLLGKKASVYGNHFLYSAIVKK